MPNTNAPFGLHMLGLNGGAAAPTFSQIPAKIASNNTTAIYQGDPVRMLSTGYIAQWTAGTAVSQLWGVFVGCQYLAAGGNWRFSPYWPGGGNSGSGDIIAFVTPVILTPAPLFVIQTDATGITQAAVGANADVVIGTGNALTGQSGAYLDVSTLATTATLPFRVVSLWSPSVMGTNVGPGTDSGAYNWAVVAANVSGSTGI